MARSQPLLGVLVALSLGCVGEIESISEVPPPTAGPRCTDGVGRIPMHRLNAAELDRTLQDVLGIRSEPSRRLASSLGRFDNDSLALANLSEREIEQWVDLTASVVDEAFELNRSRLVTCAPSDGCLRETLTVLAERVFRRPAEAEEISDLMTLAQTKEPVFDDGLRLAMRALIASPSFMYRTVAPPPDASVGAAFELQSFELATRLSYFLWGTSPDEELFEAARGGELRAEPELRAEVRRMLQSPRFVDHMGAVLTDWFELDEIAGHEADITLYPAFSQGLVDDLAMETHLWMRDWLMRGENPSALVSSQRSFLNERLAEYYEVEGFPQSHQGDTSHRLVEEGIPHRIGLLTHGGVLMMNSHPDRTSIIERGVWVLEKFFCVRPPPPPDDVADEARPANFEGTRRELAELHREETRCARCHNLIDPLGFAFENFDPIGAYRVAENGVDIDASGTLPNGAAFADLEEFGTLVRASPQVRECLASHFLRYALARKLEAHDECATERITDMGLSDDDSMEDFVMAVITTDSFTHQRVEAEE